MSDSNNNGRTIRGTIASTLTTISHATSPFIAVFLLVHLAAPVLANVGGTDLASRTMLLGREYYQSSFGENYLVLGPITIHALAGIAKRLLTTSKQDTKNNTKKDIRLFNRPFTSLHSLTGHAIALILLPIHFLVHRDYPSLPIEPIASVGPASLDYEYVKYGLHTWPWRSWFLYVGIVGSVILHAADGMTIVFNRYFRKGGFWGGLSRRTRRNVVVGVVGVPVLFGLITMAKEPLMIMSFLESRYNAAYTQSSVFW